MEDWRTAVPHHGLVVMGDRVWETREGLTGRSVMGRGGLVGFESFTQLWVVSLA